MKAAAWVRYGCAVIVIPCAVVAGVELLLRLSSAGYNPHFFRRVKGSDGVYCVDNPEFGRRFFPSPLVRRSDKLRFRLRKDEDEYRIFVLGSSAAQGDPAPAFSFTRQLERLLRGRYGTKRCRVINTAVTATNSHVVVPIARECSRLSPDLFIVYLGNNEVIGPFGPGTVFAGFSSRLIIRLRIFLSATRLGQLAAAVSSSGGNNRGMPAGWGGLKMFLQHKIRFDDPRLERVYRNYRENLREICMMARRSKARVAVCTVAANSKDCGPFFSMNRPELSPDSLSRWQGYYNQAVDAQHQGRYREALDLFELAAVLDSTFADQRYRMAQCLSALGRDDQARRQYRAARDHDALRFRADSRINRIVGEVAGEFSDCAVLIDMEDRLAGASGQGSCGGESFLEHVHGNFHGNYLLASGVVPVIDSLVVDPVGAPLMPTEFMCREQLAYTPWEEMAIDREVHTRLTRPPFTAQEDNTRRAQVFKRELERLSAFVADSGASVVAAYQFALSREPDDWWLHYLFGRYLLMTGGSPAAVEQAFRSVLQKMPHDQYSSYNLAIVLERQGRTDEAISYFRKAIENDPLFFDAYVSLADDLAMTGQIDEAEEYLERVVRINPSFPPAKARYEHLMNKRKKKPYEKKEKNNFPGKK